VKAVSPSKDMGNGSSSPTNLPCTQFSKGNRRCISFKTLLALLFRFIVKYRGVQISGDARGWYLIECPPTNSGSEECEKYRHSKNYLHRPVPRAKGDAENAMQNSVPRPLPRACFAPRYTTIARDLNVVKRRF